CPVKDCEKSFTTRVNLEGHLRSHTGEKPFTCAKGCGRRFARRSDCVRHLATHGLGHAHVCPVCNRHYTRRDAALKHLAGR
ncbi:hypothetical protein PUNSTDRAFT_66912, partial [Punctularia strigosozonata HHB-11173 SS5]|uniref:uncharacterized protein n=1 Tax=Punctularia strigosozonata (strain HHB-11173) TaxID=741275 RepID=UPI0004416331